jgi:hypothetical protein
MPIHSLPHTLSHSLTLLHIPYSLNTSHYLSTSLLYIIPLSHSLIFSLSPYLLHIKSLLLCPRNRRQISYKIDTRRDLIMIVTFRHLGDDVTVTEESRIKTIVIYEISFEFHIKLTPPHFTL